MVELEVEIHFTLGWPLKAIIHHILGRLLEEITVKLRPHVRAGVEGDHGQDQGSHGGTGGQGSPKLGPGGEDAPPAASHPQRRRPADGCGIAKLHFPLNGYSGFILCQPPTLSS